jgi:hypothetical protein
MTQLDCWNCTILQGELGDLCMPGYLTVGPQSGASMGYSATFLDGRRFSKNNPSPANRETAKVYQMPIVQMAFMRGILTHG